MRKQLSLRAAKQAGFTLIELIIVIVIIGILAAVAIPKYTSLAKDARLAAVKGLAGNLSSASAVNFGTRSANSSNGFKVESCADVASNMQPAIDTDAYAIDGDVTAADGTGGTCTITDKTDEDATANFTALAID